MLKSLSAIAIAASPGLGSVCITAFLASTRIFDPEKIKVFFPIRTLFLQWRRAEADFHPGAGAVLGDPGLRHVD